MQSKRLRILQAIADRCSAINTSSGFFSDVGFDVQLSRRDPSEDDAPCVRVYQETTTPSESQRKRALMDFPVIVTAFDRARYQEPAILGEQLLADLARAVELDDETLGNLLCGAAHGLQPTALDVYMPEPGGDIVAASITYAAPYIRQYGDPEIA